MFLASFYMSSSSSFSHDEACCPFSGLAAESLASCQPWSFSHGWPWQRFMVNSERASCLPRPGAWNTEQPLLLRTNHGIQGRSRSRVRPESPQIPPSPHLQMGKHTNSRNTNGSGVQLSDNRGRLHPRTKPV